MFLFSYSIFELSVKGAIGGGIDAFNGWLWGWWQQLNACAHRRADVKPP